jgi:amino acid transporter
VLEAELRLLVVAGAFGSSLLAFVLLLAIGAFLAGFEQTGARGTGLLLVVCAVVAFSAALFLVFARPGYFGGRLRRPLGMVVTFVAAAPVVALAWAALFFTGLPLGTDLPLMDWPLFAAGLVLALGSVSILALGYRRASERIARSAPAAEPASAERDEEEIRVRRV